MLFRIAMPRMLCCAAALFACSANALAETRSGSAFSDLTGFSWQLIDLDPNDGIVPELTITSQSNRVGSFYDSDPYAWEDDAVQWLDGYGSAAANGPRGSASAQLDAAASHTRANLTSADHYYASTGSYGTTSLYFTLTPYTGLLFNAGASAGFDLSDTGSSYAYAEASFSGSLSNGPDTSRFREGFVLTRSAFAGPQAESQDYILSGYLHTNHSAASGQFEFSNYSNVTLQGPTPAIPEPQTYAMLLAGLGLIGAGARRRARARASA